MNLDCMKTTDDAESELDFIWTQAKILELMAMSMLQRQRFFSSSSVYRMTARTFQQCDKMVERVFHIHAKDLSKKQLSYMIQMDLKYEGVFLAEWDLYELILFHLIGNAVKFSNSGGSITVVLSPRETFIDSMSRTTLKTVVRDRGVGITDDKMKSIK